MDVVDQETIPYGNCNHALDYADQMEPGFRFCPTDSELIIYYLNAKIQSRNLPKLRLHEVNIYNHKPDELAEQYRSREKKWYFLTPRDRKYRKGNRPDRAVGNFGFWKTTQKLKPVFDATGQMVGHKGRLAFYNKDETKTMWLMHEYTTNGPNLPFGSGENSKKLNEWVLCKMYKNKKESKQTPSPTSHRVEEIPNTAYPEDSNGTRPRPKRRRVSGNRESKFSSHTEHVQVQEGNRHLGSHVQIAAPVGIQRSVNEFDMRRRFYASMGSAHTWSDHGVGYNNRGTLDDLIRMNITPYPIPMQPMATFQDSSLIIPTPCYQNQCSSNASDAYQFSDGASSSASTEPPAVASQQFDDGAYTTPTKQCFNSIQPMQRERYQNMFSSTACNSFQLSNGALNSSSVEPLDYGGYTPIMAQTPWNYNVLQHVQNSYQDAPSLLNLKDGWNQSMVVPQDDAGDLPQPDGHDTTLSAPDETECTLEFFERYLDSVDTLSQPDGHDTPLSAPDETEWSLEALERFLDRVNTPTP
ncbi:hypothetical protein L2E82_26777 [Cichorium intybus]|uniref:Uncharacterized protein n=1 Tax=Cichorium intybus TaxID=13427 RepID=A0ACB9CRF1_CICIN|nr:hypothetical protein L2E82_26777 [Cichorium intybus]